MGCFSWITKNDRKNHRRQKKKNKESRLAHAWSWFTHRIRGKKINRVEPMPDREAVCVVENVLESLIDDAVRNAESAARHRDMMAAVTRELTERADERNTRVAVQKYLDYLLVEVMVATEYRERHGAMLRELLSETRKSSQKQNRTAACNYVLESLLDDVMNKVEVNAITTGEINRAKDSPDKDATEHVITGMMEEVYGEVSHLLTYVAAGNVNPVDNGARKFLEEDCACAKPSTKAHGDGGDVDAAVNACISATVGDFMSGEFLKMLPSSDYISPDNVKPAENKKPPSKKLSKIADSICDDLLADIMSKLKR